ncbi:hypothetical protein MO867_14795 [Microbulbifer sp. OS29]|uniref:Uncharacterized protein n=1 Tax=Microbulbifer okhotskensis TaxID=2926617 RepID=A0A9X2EPV3_9GAMM|nr:hypothetical protein [Microbulbifer okhotskensis]MCO1335604.1 hypothetical protein [Microbulbifer okhotskensis]
MNKRDERGLAQPVSQPNSGTNLFLLLVAAASLNPKFAVEIQESSSNIKSPQSNIPGGQ